METSLINAFERDIFGLTSERLVHEASPEKDELRKCFQGGESGCGTFDARAFMPYRTT
jgi:hypothetical protein